MTMERRSPRAALAVVSGLLICFSMPPWGWWPLTPLGIAGFAWLIEGRDLRGRFATGALVGLGWFLPSTLWMVKFSFAGWPIGVAIWFPFVTGVAAMLCPPRRAAIALPGALILSEWFRWHAPFGGVPLSMLAMPQATGPLLRVAVLGGTLGVSAAVAVVGSALGAMPRPEMRRGAAVALAAVAVVGAVGFVAPNGHRTGTLRIAAIQGGGEQQSIHEFTDYDEVYRRHLEAARTIDEPVDVVVFPENILNISGFYEGSNEQRMAEELAAELDAVVVLGIVEERGDPERFWNSAVAIAPDGTQTDRYDKERRVPYGEYVPMRPLLERVAEDQLPARDAVPGEGTAVLETDLGTLGVVISWEVFFPRRVRESVRNDAAVILNPTNGSSYWLTQVQTQQIASSSLRAAESGRWLVQASPTGFSAVIDPDGRVIDRTGLEEQAVIIETVELRDGDTLANLLGATPALILAACSLGWAWRHDRRSRSIA